MSDWSKSSRYVRLFFSFFPLHLLFSNSQCPNKVLPRQVVAQSIEHPDTPTYLFLCGYLSQRKMALTMSEFYMIYLLSSHILMLLNLNTHTSSKHSKTCKIPFSFHCQQILLSCGKLSSCSTWQSTWKTYWRNPHPRPPGGGREDDCRWSLPVCPPQ